ncbi:MAG TPA: hypothetical protein VLH08_08920 [Acidobacteriota bacterium]|nr:hypothetical protein [Acidobacteriota bacterium]
MRIVTSLAVAPLLATEIVTSQNTTQATQNTPSPTVKDIFFHPQGVGQSSSWGQRTLTPEQIQNITPEQLAERERRMKMANAGVEAGVQGANAVGGILPTGGPEEILPQMIISESVERIVDAKTTAPQTQTREPKANDPKTAPAQPGTDSAPKTEPTPYVPVKQRDIGAKLNPNYVDPFDVPSTEKPRFWPEGPKPKTAPVPDPKKKVSIKITLSPDNKVPLDPKQVQLKTSNLPKK